MTRKLAAAFVTLVLTVAVTADQQTAVDYRFDEVKRNVTLNTVSAELKVSKGQKAQGGDRVKTGMFSYALVASDRYRAKFEIFGSTDVQLTSGTAGVILSVERGRLHAIFDKITGNEPRVVQTPGALLAVRGTEYTVTVDNAGRTRLDVFEGIVEVRSDLRPEPLLVRAGQESTFGRREPPQVRPMPSDRRPDGSRGAPRTQDGQRQDPHGSTGREGFGGHGGGGSQPQPRSPQPQPGMHPPPNRPPV